MYAVDLDLLADTLARLQAVEAGLERLDTELAARVGGLPASWTGDAAAAHAAAHARWSAAFADLRAALGAMRAAGRVAHDNYTDAVAANLALWEQVG